MTVLKWLNSHSWVDSSLILNFKKIIIRMGQRVITSLNHLDLKNNNNKKKENQSIFKLL